MLTVSPSPLKRRRNRPWLILAAVAAVVVVALALSHRIRPERSEEQRAGSSDTQPGANQAAFTPPVMPDVPDEWKGPHGRWHRGDWREAPFEAERQLTLEQQAEVERLRSIGYLSGSEPMPLQSHVTVYDASRTYDGLNFYTSGDEPGAVLMDMRGRVIHRWTYSYVDAWKRSPERPELRPSPKGSGFWRRAHLFENGDVLAVIDGLAILKVDRNSNLLWVAFGGYHHDLEVMEDGTIFVLTREAHIVERYNPDHPILEDYIALLDAGGTVLHRVSILKAIENSAFASILEHAKDHGDIFHTNTIEVLDGTLARDLPAFRAGNVLVTIREMDIAAVIDLGRESVVWTFMGEWDAPHQATVLDTGTFMIFDNRGNKGSSRVIELDPVSMKTVWVYRGDEPADFRSRECGSNQRLPNGNTLITESDRGKAFEVTPDGEIVWKYINPAQAGEELDLIASLFDMVRLPPDFPIEWAKWKDAMRS